MKGCKISFLMFLSLVLVSLIYEYEKSKPSPVSIIDTKDSSIQFGKSWLYLTLVAEFANKYSDYGSAINSYRALYELTDDPKVLDQLVMTYINNGDLKNALLYLEKRLKYSETEDLLALKLALMFKYEISVKNRDKNLVFEFTSHFNIEKIILYFEFLNFDTFDYLSAIDIFQREGANIPIEKPDKLILYLAMSGNSWEKALDITRHTEDLSSINSDVLSMLFFQFLKGGSFNAALKWLETLEKKQGRKPYFSIMKAEIFRLQKNSNLALATLTKAVEEFPLNNQLLFLKASYLVEFNLLEEARAAFLFLLQQNYKYDEVQFLLATIAEINNSHSKAINHYLNIKKHNSELYFMSRSNTARLMFSAGAIDDSFALIDRLQLDFRNRFIELTQLKVELLFSDNKLELAMLVLNESISRIDFNRDLMYTRALLADQLGNVDLLERDLRRILSFFPNDADALNALGYSLTNLTNRYEEAYDLISRALEIKGDSFYILDSMGWICFKIGDLERATFFLEKAYGLSQDEEITRHLVEVLNASGQYEKAKIILDKS